MLVSDEGVGGELDFVCVPEFEQLLFNVMTKNGDLTDEGCGRLSPRRDEMGEVTGHGGVLSGWRCGGAEECDLVEDDLGEIGRGADGAGVGEVFAAQVVGVVSEDVALAGGGAGLGLNPKQDGDVLVGVESVRDEERNDDDVRELGEGIPFRDERGLFHVGVENFAKDTEFADFFDFSLCGECGVVIEIGAVSDDEKAGLFERKRSGDLASSFQEKFRHFRVVSDGLAVMDRFFANGGGCSGEFEFAGDDGSGEVTFTNKVWHHVNGRRIDHVEDLAEAGFFFPKSAVDFPKVAGVAKGCGVIEGGGAGVRVLGGTVSDDDESRFFGVGHGGSLGEESVWLRKRFGNRAVRGKNRGGLGLFSARQGRDG